MHINFQDVRQYLASVLPWPADDEPGFINIVWSFNKAGVPKPLFSPGRACRTVDEALNVIRWIASRPDTFAIYVCQSLQSAAIDKTSKGGHPYREGLRSQHNALKLRSLFLDVDLKDYNSSHELNTAVSKFIKIACLPWPTVGVNSGGGLHLYWVFKQPITPAEWQPLAHALVEATKKVGLKCDTQCTIDSARILRVAGTPNNKYVPVQFTTQMVIGEPQLLERMQWALEPYLAVTPLPMPPRPPLQGENELAAGIEAGQASPIDIATVLPHCPFLLDALRTEGAHNPNPLWHLTTLLSTFMEGGDQLAHLMSREHPTYTREETQKLYERKVREREERNIGWPACRTIHASGATQCATCPHLQEGKSPLHFGRRAISIVTAGMPQDDLPPWYVRNEKGIVIATVRDDQGNVTQQPVCNLPILNGWIQSEPEWVLNFTTTTNVRKQIHLPTGIVNTNEMRKHLQKQGFMLPENTKLLVRFLLAWIDKLRQTKNAVVSTAPFGWIENDKGIEGFAYNGAVWTPDVPRVAPNPDPTLAKVYRPVGDIQSWKDAARLVLNMENTPLDVLIATSFASPLVKFTYKQGLTVSCYSKESGIGKTTALQVAQSVWGNHISAMFMLDDTTNDMASEMGTTKSLPSYWDELKSQKDVEAFVKIVFKMTGGRDKKRMRADTSLREPGRWNTLLTLCSNESLLDVITHHQKTTPAGLYRVFEFTAAPSTKGVISQAVAGRIAGKLDSNYGHVGLEYAKFLGANAARIHDEVHALHVQLDTDFGFHNEERNWSAIIAAILMGAKYATDQGYCTFDQIRMRDFLFEKLEALRKLRQNSAVDMNNVDNLVEVVSMYLNVMRDRHTLSTDKMWHGGGRPPPGAINTIGDTTKLTGGIFIRVAHEDKLIRIGQNHFRDWLMKNGYPASNIIDNLEKKMGAKFVKGRLAAGTGFASGGDERLWEIDLTKNPQLDFIG